MAYARSGDVGDAPRVDTAEASDGGARRSSGLLWAELMQRTFGFDVLACPRCGGRMRLIALIEQEAVVHRILRHLGLPSELPAAHPARAPPMPLNAPDDAWSEDAPQDPCS